MKRFVFTTCLAAAFAVGLAAQQTTGTSGSTTPDPQDGQGRGGGPRTITGCLRAGETAGTRAWFVIAGLLSIAFGVVLAARPDMGAVSLAVIYGIFSLAFGISQVVLGVQARRIGLTTPDSLAHA